MHKEALLQPLPYAFYRAQGGIYLCLAAQISVESNTEAMSLVANLLKHLQGQRITVYEKRVRVPYPDNLFKPLCKADDG